MISRLIRGAMNLARPIEYSVQTRWTILVSFEWLLPLTGFRSTESGVDRCVFGIFISASMLVFVASWLAVYPWLQRCQGHWCYCLCELASYLLPCKSGS